MKSSTHSKTIKLDLERRATIDEIKVAIKLLRNGKTVGMDEVMAEALRIGGNYLTW